MKRIIENTQNNQEIQDNCSFIDNQYDRLKQGQEFFQNNTKDIVDHIERFRTNTGLNLEKQEVMGHCRTMDELKTYCECVILVNEAYKYTSQNISFKTFMEIGFVQCNGDLLSFKSACEGLLPQENLQAYNECQNLYKEVNKVLNFDDETYNFDWWYNASIIQRGNTFMSFVDLRDYFKGELAMAVINRYEHSPLTFKDKIDRSNNVPIQRMLAQVEETKNGYEAISANLLQSKLIEKS